MTLSRTFCGGKIPAHLGGRERKEMSREAPEPWLGERRNNPFNNAHIPLMGSLRTGFREGGTRGRGDGRRERSATKKRKNRPLNGSAADKTRVIGRGKREEKGGKKKNTEFCAKRENKKIVGSIYASQSQRQWSKTK